jgi:hypothetical protein
MMNNRRFIVDDRRAAPQASAPDTEIERVRRHVARIRSQIQDLERRTRSARLVVPAYRRP